MRLVGIQAEALGGSFHEAAAHLYYADNLAADIALSPVATHSQLLSRFLIHNEFDEIVTAVDNTVSGRVNTSTNALRDHAPEFYVVGSITMDVEQKLLIHPDTDPDTITHVITQKPARVQCKDNIAKAGLTAVDVDDTLGAAIQVKERGGIINGHVTAAIASGLAAQTTGLHILRHAFNDSPFNATKFWVVQPLKKEQKHEGTHTAITFEVPDVAGGLREATRILRKNGINLTDIDSHLAPTDTKHRAFFAELLEQEKGTVARALRALRLKDFAPIILGSYTPLNFSKNLTNGSSKHEKPSHEGWPGQEGLKRPPRAETLYIVTDHRIGALDKVLTQLKNINILDMARPKAPNDTDLNRGFYFVLDPRTDKAEVRTAVSGVEREGYNVERIPAKIQPKKQLV